MLVRKPVWIIVGIAFLIYAVHWTASVEAASMFEACCGAVVGVGCLYIAFNNKKKVKQE